MFNSITNLIVLIIFSVSVTKTCETTEPDIIISQNIGNIFTLKHAFAENNQPVIITLTDKVQVWQDDTGSWQADTLELLCEPISMQVITDPATQKPDIIVGAQSCFNKHSGIFVVFQQDNNGWKSYSSDVIDNTGAFYNINAFVTPDNYLDVTASGSKNNRIYFLNGQKKSGLK
jgi:hypothetical protein